MNTESASKCLICGKLVEDIGDLDVPYHVECVLRRLEQSRGKIVNDKKEVDSPYSS